MDEITGFITNVGLITSHGPHGHNVMTCEWTHQLSYDPPLIAVCIRPGKTTFENIQASSEFGVNIAAFDQNIVASVAGNNHGKTVDKISLLKELGVTFYNAKTINALMIAGASLNAECQLIKFIDIGDHPLFIGEVQSVKQTAKEPLIYHQGKYFRIGDRIHKPDQSKLDAIAELVKKHTRKL
jgi:flavin reductase (DIM6/NTAB) family NADH-FMN oxidoreductase RutF